MKKSNLFKRILAYTLVLSIVFSQIVFTSSVSAAENISVWDGTKAESFAGGDGTATSPFLIETAEQLYKMVADYSTRTASLGRYFKITKDIYLNDVADGSSIVELWGKKNWLADYSTIIPELNDANSFCGTLDGAGHTIYGLYVDGARAGGLFPVVSSGVTIKNINLENVLVTGGSGYGGAIAGQLRYVDWKLSNNFTNCSVVNATIGQWENIGFVGGFIGNAEGINVTFSNCYSRDVNLSNWVASGIPGGIVGLFETDGTLTMNNCYSEGNFITNSKVSKAKCTNVYTDVAIPEGNTTAGVTVLTSEQMKGEAAKTNMAGFDFEYTWQTTENGYPELKYIEFWDGTKAIDYAGGSGTENDPYLIENGAQLFKMASENTASTGDAVFTTPKYFKITKDIYLNRVTEADMLEPTVDAWNAKGFKNWLPGYNYKQSTGFCGNIDGDGKTIYGLYNGEGTYAGFLPNVVDSATVINLHFKNAFVRAGGNGGPGGIIGIVNGATNNRSTATVSYCSMDNCYIFADATGSWRCGAIVGGGVGEGKITVTNCVVTNMKMKVTNTGTPNRTCAFIGNTNTYNGHEVTNCFTDDSAHPVTDSTTSDMYKVIHDNKVYTNVYTSAAKPDCDTNGDITYLTADQMKGENAKQYMPTLDYEFEWQTVEGGFPVVRKNPIYGWDGAKAENFAGGTGTAEDPFLIANGGQLYKMVAEYSNADVTVKPETQTYFKLTKDINLGGKQWYVTGTTSYPNASNYKTGFNGIIYGEGHTIYGLYSNKSSGMVGLIPTATQGAEIHDLHLESGNLPKAAWNTYAIGAFIGLAAGSSSSTPIIIDNCSVKDFTIESRDASAAFIGLLYSQSVVMNNCYSVNVAVSHTNTTDLKINSGAFIGVTDGNDWENSIVITNSYSDTTSPLMYANDAFKAIITYENVYTANEAYDDSIAGLTKLTTAQMTGVAAKENLAGFNFNQIWQYGAEGEYPTHKTEDVKAMYWDGTAAVEFAVGEGTEEKPYEVSSAAELYLLANSDTANTYGKYFKLTNDIEISDTYDGWENDSPYSWAKKNAYLDGYTYSNSFAGTLDGNGYTVSGLYYEDVIDNGAYAYGLIPFVTADAVIKNLNVENISGNVAGEAYAGAVVGAVHVTELDALNPLKMVQFVGVNVTNSNVALLGGATRGVKFELCNAETLIGIENENISVRNCNGDAKYDNNVIIYNSLNADSTMLVTLRNNFLGENDYYITDINGDSTFDARDVVSAKKALTMTDAEEVLVWSDEFEGDSLDYSVWSTNTTMSRGTTLEYADNATVENGILKLSCKDTEKKNSDGDTIYSVNYGLDTLDKMSFKYGRLEMRAKVPFAAGAFPSLWLTSRSAIGYDPFSEYSTEIDIFEVFGKTNNNDRLITCIHKWYNKDGVKTGDECSCGTGILAGNGYKVEEADRDYLITGDAQNEFHTFVFEWTENAMTFSVDGDIYYTALRSKMNRFDLSGYSTNSDGIFNQAVCIRLNNHMYTTGEGAAYTYTGNASEIDASKINYEIDYIRLYQKNDGKSEITLK